MLHVALVTFPGTNREHDMVDALHHNNIHNITFISHKETYIPDVDLIILPGGFSFGDYLRSGAMAARSPIMDAIKEHAEKGTAIMGVCNGFQILTESGLLPGALLCNKTMHFICKTVTLRVETTRSLFTSSYTSGHVLRIPVAHHDGCYFADDATIKQLEDENRIVFRYSDQEGNISDASNINGSCHNIAGILNKKGNILGMMPHFENATLPFQKSQDGNRLFMSMIESLKA